MGFFPDIANDGRCCQNCKHWKVVIDGAHVGNCNKHERSPLTSTFNTCRDFTSKLAPTKEEFDKMYTCNWNPSLNYEVEFYVTQRGSPIMKLTSIQSAIKTLFVLLVDTQNVADASQRARMYRSMIKSGINTEAELKKHCDPDEFIVSLDLYTNRYAYISEHANPKWVTDLVTTIDAQSTLEHALVGLPNFVAQDLGLSFKDKRPCIP